MEGWRLVDSAIKDVVKGQARGFFGRLSHLLVDDEEVGLLGIMNGVLYPRRHCSAQSTFSLLMGLIDSYLYFFEYAQAAVRAI